MISVVGGRVIGNDIVSPPNNNTVGLRVLYRNVLDSTVSCSARLT